MTFITTFRSLLERPMRKGISHFSEQRLIVGFPTTERVEADDQLAQIHFCPDQPMHPIGTDLVGVAQDVDASAVVCATQEDDYSPQRFLPVETPALGKGPSCWRSLDAGGMALPYCGEVSERTALQAVQRGMLKSRPDLALPAGVEAFDSRLEAGFVGRDENWRHAQQQAQAGHAAQGVGVLPRPAEALIVVELSISWQAVYPPIFQQPLHHVLGVESALRPGDHPAAMQGNTGKDRQMRTTANRQAFDGIEAVQFDASGCHLWQVPAFRWRRTSDPAASVQNTVSLQDAADRGNRGAGGNTTPLYFAIDGRG